MQTHRDVETQCTDTQTHYRPSGSEPDTEWQVKGREGSSSRTEEQVGRNGAQTTAGGKQDDEEQETGTGNNAGELSVHEGRH